MKTFLSLLPWFLVFVMTLFFIKGYNLVTPQYERAMQPANVQAMKDLAGKYFEWTYVDTDKSESTFNIRIIGKQIFIICSEGSIEGSEFKGRPQFTKVGDMVYFLTWTTYIGGEESIVLDCKNDKVYAHINSTGRFWGMTGTITCNGFNESCKTDFNEARDKFK